MRVRVTAVLLVFSLVLAVPATAGAFTTVSAFRSALQRRVNHFRADYGRGPLHVNIHLARSAEAHSTDMARHHNFSHSCSTGVSWIQRLRYWGYRGRWMGENLAVARNITARQVMRMWRASAPHRANLLNGHFHAVGIGAHKGRYSGVISVYVTADFGG
jgi:uncharacterized protein YkwD